MIITKRHENGLVEYQSDRGLPLKQVGTGMIFPNGAIEVEGKHRWEEVEPVEVDID